VSDGSAMSDDEILAMIKEALRSTVPERAADFEHIRLGSDLRDIAISSVSMMEMVCYIEDRLAMTFRLEDLGKIAELRDLANLIRGARPDHGPRRDAGAA
jgi:acyl carrier protein